jgi:predicted nucleotidyltransferase
MSAFSESQLQDLRDLQSVARDLGAEAVIIGAMAYRLFIEDADRQTYDIDLAIALDLDELERLGESLTALGWRPQETQEQRWMTSRDNRFDLVPAGPSLRKEGRIVWPRSGFVMSLAGFDHVFQDATPQDVGGGLLFKAVPPRVLALLKMASYLDDPHRRAKDLLDFRSLMQRYECDSERLFSDEVFQAGLPDVEFAGAFLLGGDLRTIATGADSSVVNLFLERTMGSDDLFSRSASVNDDWATRDSAHFQQQLSAFLKGFKGIQ